MIYCFPQKWRRFWINFTTPARSSRHILEKTNRGLAIMHNRRIFSPHFFLTFIFLFFTLRTYAADIPETVQIAVNARTDASHKLQPPIIDAGPAMQNVYIYFVTNTSDEPGYTKNNRPYMLDAHLLFVDGNHIWHDQTFDRYAKDDGVPEIAAVFFANADHDQKNKNVVILVRTPLNHYDYGGDYYDGYVYKLTGSAQKGAVFAGLQSDASAPFLDQCECSFRDGRSTHALYKDAKSIRKKLEKKYADARR
ncbi:hypothetical protein RI103_00280 [Paraburkholderia sp. FT54]|uniref:hypothetical protein n=1 Tax=Paraburkholderia sp. FT54 TaxID=3074437 RepID=UPI002877514A|nr:hypothetical protein [Paraburkholderia sp. FT54]WNC89834.1 hypothetical protein RI103_00280 [Paraburkholderia sp. FT54]